MRLTAPPPARPVFRGGGIGRQTWRKSLPFWYLQQCLLLLALALVPPSSAAAANDGASRRTIPISAEWRFARGDNQAAQAPAYDDSGWTRITLPHSFNAGESDDGAYYRGPGWYRRTFDVTASRPDRRLFLQFDGAATRADVYINGRHAGRHDGGHAAFRFDITNTLVPGRNVIAVRVDNSPDKAISPLGGDFTVFGGLYQPVSLIETDLVHFDLLDHGGPGLYARTSEVGAEAATISVDARVANDGRLPGRVRLITRILHPDGSEVAREAQMISVPSASVRVAHIKLKVPKPRLWDGVRDPFLYRVVARIGESGDEASVPLGIRSFRIDPQLGFFLNGRPYPLRGANLMRSARPGKGTAVTRDEVAEDFAILREMGSTGVRLVHFQHSAAAYEEADRLGLATWTEIGINSEVADTPEFRANAAQQMRELIAQTYNHPSVMMWGIGNEVYSEEPYVVRILKELNEVARAADPTRPTAYAHCCQADDHPKALVTDVIGFNRYFGWYPDQSGTTIGAWAERFHGEHPERPFAVSEYGAGASILHQADPPGPIIPASGWHPEQFQTLYHERNWLELKDKPYLWGAFVWVAFDLASAGRHEGDRRGINDKGLVTYDRKTRKDAWYWYQANWSTKPMLHITSRRFTLRRDPDAEVKAYTNAGPATLLVNGAVISTATPRDHILRWRATLREGANRIEVRSSDGRLSDLVEWLYEKPPLAVSTGR